MLHLAGCLYYLYQWCTVKQISDNEIYLLIKCITSVLWRVAKRLSYIEDARCLKVNLVARWGGWSTPRPGRFTPGKTGYPLYRRLGGPQGRSGQALKNLAPTVIRSPDLPGHSESAIPTELSRPIINIGSECFMSFYMFYAQKHTSCHSSGFFLLRSVSIFQVLEGHACHQSTLLRTVSFQEGCDFLKSA